MGNPTDDTPADASGEIVRHDVGGWISGPSLPACGRCGQPKPDDGNDWCPSCEDENAADVLAALREDEAGQ